MPNTYRSLFIDCLNSVGNTDYGIFYGGDGRQLVIQILGAIIIAAWTCTINFILFGTLHRFDKLRVAKEEEINGLNASIHGRPEEAGAGTGTNGMDTHVLSTIMSQ